MATSSNSDEFPENKPKHDVSEHALDDVNLTHSVLDELGTSNVSVSSVDLQLRFQRLLAESALESSAFDVSKDDSASVSEFTLGTSTPRLNSSGASVFGPSDKKKNEEFEALFKKYYSEDFVPAEQATERLMADEIAWKKEFGFSPPVNEKLNLSCFSGIMGDAEISLRSVAGTETVPKSKVTAEEYFNLKTDKMGSLDKLLSDKERPNFGNEIESPCGNRERIAFVQDSFLETSKKTNEITVQEPIKEEPENITINKTIASKSENKIVNLNVTPVEDSFNTLSVSSIEDILSKHLQDTPGTIAKSILNTKSKAKSTIGQDDSMSTTLSENTRFKTKNIFSQDDSTSTTLSEQVSAFFDNLGEKSTEESDWIQVEVSQTEYETYVGSKENAFFHIQNKSTRWLKCIMSVHQIVCNKHCDAAVEKEMKSQMQFPDVCLIGPCQKTVGKVIVTPILPGNFEIYVNIIVEDAVTQTSKNYISKFEVISKKPKVEIFMEGRMLEELDFGILPESSSQLATLQIKNYSDCDLPMTLTLEEVSSNTHAFAFCKNDSDNNKKLSSNSGNKEKALEVSVAFKAPSLKHCSDAHNGFLNFSAYLNVTINFPGGHSCLLRKLQLKGRVGLTLLLMNFSSPVELSSAGPGESNSKTLSLKNGGLVPLNLKLVVINSATWQLDSENVIVVNKPTMELLPGQEAPFSLIFTPTWVFEERITRKLVIHVSPNGNLFEVDIVAKMTVGKREQDKERLSTQSGVSIPSAVSTTVSSSQSLTGKPIQTTHKQLVWNTVAVGKSEIQSFRLRNDCPATVKVLLTLVDFNHGFWLLSENGEHVLERKIRLHAKECVPVNVMFSPLKIGVAHGKIVIRESKRTDTTERSAIPLCGYSGTFHMLIRNVPKDKSGYMWINLGSIDSSMQTSFTVCNKGNLESFVFVKYAPKGVGAIMQGLTVNIQPKKTVIAPGSNEVINVSISLQDDVSFIANDRGGLLELGTLFLTTGDEPTRQRIRRIKEKQRGSQTIKGMSKILDLDTLCSIFPGETSISELSVLFDPENALRSLWRTLQQHEIALTAECMDDRSIAMQTCVGNGHLGNQSLIFKSMLPDATFSGSFAENSGRTSPSWSITPSNLTLLLPSFASGCITIASTHQEEQMFEIISSEDVLSVEPSSGIIPGMGEVVAVVTCNAAGITPITSIKGTLKVYLENDMKTVTVHIKATPDSLTQRNKINISNSESDVCSSKGAKNETNKKKIKTPQVPMQLQMKK